MVVNKRRPQSLEREGRNSSNGDPLLPRRRDDKRACADHAQARPEGRRREKELILSMPEPDRKTDYDDSR